jgi:hypothetical protein
MTATILTAADTRRQQAESRLLVIRNALEVADQELGRALAERDWEVYDLASFEEYCAEKLPDLVHIKLRAPERQRRTKALIDADPTVTERAIAAATGASPATAHRDRLAVTGRRPASNEATPPPSKPESRVSVILRLAGDGPVTVRELCARARIHHGAASGALSRVHRQGRVRRLLRYRDDCAVYVLQP